MHIDLHIIMASLRYTTMSCKYVGAQSLDWCMRNLHLWEHYLQNIESLMSKQVYQLTILSIISNCTQKMWLLLQPIVEGMGL